MTRQLLNKIIKTKRIDLNAYDHVSAFVNEAYTFVYVSFWTLQVTAGNRRRCGEKRVKLSVSSILKRGEEWPEDYETQPGGEWLYNIK